MGVNEGNLQVIDRCRRDPRKLSNTYCFTLLISVQQYNTVQYSTIAIIVYDSK